MAEQLRLEQVLLQRRAVHLDEVAAGAQRVVVDGAGDQLLAGAGLAADEHGRVALGHLADHAEHPLQRVAGADDLVEVVVLLLLVAQVVELVAEALQLERLLDLDLHLLDLERLLDVVEGPVLHRLDRGRHRAEGGHQDHRRGRVGGAGGAQHVEAVGAAHAQVADHDVEVAVVQPLDGGVAVGRLLHFVTRRAQRQREPAPQRVVIVGDQNATHVRSAPTTPARRRSRAARRGTSCRPLAGWSGRCARRGRRRSCARWPGRGPTPAAWS